MKKKIITAFSLLTLLVSLNTMAIAEDVYVTKYGKKYHKEGSRFIKDRDVEKLTRKEAEELGYKPSSDFEEIVDEEKSKKSK